MRKRSRRPGFGWATVAFVLGIGVSVAANVAHTWHPSPHILKAYAELHNGSAAGWRPELGAQAMAAFYPLALFLTIEILSRVPWPHSFGWNAARYGGTAMVAGVAAVVSYRHMAGLLAAYGEDGLTAAIGPLSVDGLMVVASFALLATGRHPVPDAVPAEVRVPGPLAANGYTLEDRTPAAPLRPLRLAELDDTHAETDEVEPVPSDVPDPDPVQVRAAAEFSDEITAGKVPGIRRIRQTLKIGQDRAQHVQAYLTVLAEM